MLHTVVLSQYTYSKNSFLMNLATYVSDEGSFMQCILPRSLCQISSPFRRHNKFSSFLFSLSVRFDDSRGAKLDGWKVFQNLAQILATNSSLHRPLEY